MFIKEEGRGGPELFWNPSEEVRRQRLSGTVLLEEQSPELGRRVEAWALQDP